MHDMGRVEGRLWHASGSSRTRLRTSRLCRTLSVPLFTIETLTAVHAMPRWHQRRPPVSATSSSATHPAGRWNVHPEARHHSSSRPINPPSCCQLPTSASVGAFMTFLQKRREWLPSLTRFRRSRAKLFASWWSPSAKGLY